MGGPWEPIDETLEVLGLLCEAAGVVGACAVGVREAGGVLRTVSRFLGPASDSGRWLRAAIEEVERRTVDPETADAREPVTALAGVPDAWKGLLAGVLSARATHPWVLHHVGFRHPNADAFRRALELRAAAGETPRESAAPDHERGYTPVRDRYGRVRYYLEDQYFPAGPHDSGRHWDLVTPDPMGLIEVVARAAGAAARPLGTGARSPWAAVWVTDESAGSLGVMARPDWWEVPAS